MPKREIASIGFVGLGAMGAPMCRVIAGKHPALAIYDLDQDRAAALAAEIGATAVGSLGDLAARSDLVITMLPNADIVRAVCLGDDGLAGKMAPGGLIVDMSSSYPIATRELGKTLAERNIVLLDAPVSGGVRKAADGSLAIMLGGDDAGGLDTAEPVLAMMGRVFRTGPLGSGHALKALNNYVSAAGLAAASEAVLVGRAFGLDPERMIDVINASTGRNNSTENKFKPFILSGDYKKAAFALDLMAKDIRAAAELADELDLPMAGLTAARDLWRDASADLGPGADHTEIHRFIARRSGAEKA